MVKDPTAAERQRARRQRLKAQGLKAIWARGTSGAFDPRLHVSNAIQELVRDGTITERLVRRIVEQGADCSLHPRNSPEWRYHIKQICIFLGVEDNFELKANDNS